MTAVPSATLRVSLDPSSIVNPDSNKSPQQKDPPLHNVAEKSATTTADDGVDPRFVLPKCELPPRNELEPVEIFVASAVREQNEQPDTALPLKNYRGILEALRFKKDVPMLRKVMIALRTSKNTLNLLVASQKHARLIHQIVRFVPFSAADNDSEVSASLEESYSLADAQFHLIVALVSANSVYLVPALTALWKMLTFQITDADEGRYVNLAPVLHTVIPHDA